MDSSNKEIPTTKPENFSSTADLTTNKAFESTLTLDVENEKEYEPYDHRQVPLPNSDFGSLTHLLKSSMGSGILAMPNAFKNAGLVVGSLGTVILGLICTHCVHVFVKISYALCKKAKVPSMTFAETAGTAFRFGPPAIRKFSGIFQTFVDWGLICTCLGTSCVYVLLIADSFHEVLDYYIGPEFNWDVRAYCGILFVPLLFLGQIRNLKYLVPFSAIANALLLTTLGIVFYYVFQGIPPPDDKPLSNSIIKLPMFISTVIFAMEGIGVVMPVENEMKKPQHFLGCPGVLNIAMGIVIALYTTIGLFGYLKYGDLVRPSITSTLCEEYIPAQIAKIFIGLAIFFTYGLQFYVPMDLIFRMTQPRTNPKNHNIIQIVVRTLCVILTVIVAVVVPKLDLLISFVGAVFFSTLGLLVPAIVEIVFLWDIGYGFLKWKLWKDIAIGLFSLIALLSGASLSLNEMINGPNNSNIGSACDLGFRSNHNSTFLSYLK